MEISPAQLKFAGATKMAENRDARAEVEMLA
jgi:hypothetical protein